MIKHLLDAWEDGLWGACQAQINELRVNMGSNDYPEILENLDIDLSWSEIENIFKKYSIIQLRRIDINAHQLLLGCGNSPLETHLYGDHFHKGMITINPDLLMNPTIVAAFGTHDLSQILPKNRYDALVFEYLGNFMYTESFQKALNASYFTNNMKFYHIDENNCLDGSRGSIVRDKDGFDQISEIDKKSIFEDDERH